MTPSSPDSAITASTASCQSRSAWPTCGACSTLSNPPAGSATIRPRHPRSDCDMEQNMSRIFVLTAALLCLIVTITVQGQEGRQAGGRGQAVMLPDGPGKEMVQGMCASCHNLNTVT